MHGERVKKRNMSVNRRFNFSRWKCDQERRQKYFKILRPGNRNTDYLEFKNKAISGITGEN